MDQFHSLQIIQKIPVLMENESIILFAENVSIYDGDQLSVHQKGTVALTQLRVIWMSGNTMNSLHILSIGLYHDAIISVEQLQTGFFGIGSSPKISISTRSGKELRLSFHTSQRDEFLRLYKNALLERQAYHRQIQLKQQQTSSPASNNTTSPTGLQNTTTTTTSPTTPKNNVNFDTSNAGISGLIKQMNKKNEETDKVLSEAFSDLTALMDKAKEMVSLSEKLQLTMEKQQKKEQQPGDSNQEEEEFRSFLVQMGIPTPVTKKTAKSQYHNELSKQLSDWMVEKQILSKQGGGKHLNSGMIPLADLYCIFNRARGIELISPDDLYRACLLFESLQLPMRLRKFESGVMVVQSIDENDEQVAKEIIEIIRENGGFITPFNLSKIQNISLNLSKEKLMACEKLEKLCRDETLEGIAFYENNIFV